MGSPRTPEEFIEQFVYPTTNARDDVESVEPGLYGGWTIEFVDGWIWGIPRVELVQRGDD